MRAKRVENFGQWGDQYSAGGTLRIFGIGVGQVLMGGVGGPRFIPPPIVDSPACHPKVG